MPKKLVRSSKDRFLFGVCGGMGKYFETDSNIIRILFVVGFFLAGATLLVYIIMFLLLPLDTEVKGGK